MATEIQQVKIWMEGFVKTPFWLDNYGNGAHGEFEIQGLSVGMVY